MFKQFNSNQLQKIQQPNSILRDENCENQNKDHNPMRLPKNNTF